MDLTEMNRTLNLDLAPTMGARDVQHIIDQMLAKGEKHAVHNGLTGEKVGTYFTLGSYTLLIAPSRIPDGFGFRITGDFKISVVNKTRKLFPTVLVRDGQEAPVYAGNDFKFRGI